MLQCTGDICNALTLKGPVSLPMTYRLCNFRTSGSFTQLLRIFHSVVIHPEGDTGLHWGTACLGCAVCVLRHHEARLIHNICLLTSQEVFAGLLHQVSRPLLAIF